MDILFAEWLYGRPHWRAARHFLCDALAKQIAEERVKAEADFDSAVAVSEDGTKIVHADRVVVKHDQDPWIAFVYRGEVFRSRKILLSECMERMAYSLAFTSGVNGASIDEYIAQVAAMGLGVQFAEPYATDQVLTCGASIQYSSRRPISAPLRFPTATKR